MPWEISSEKSVYLQLIDVIKQKIMSGEYQPGQRLPSVRELAADAAVNPNTMQRALTELEREGLLVGGGTSGRKVTTDAEILNAMKDRILWELARECAEKFMVFGVTPTQAAQLLRDLEDRKEQQK